MSSVLPGSAAGWHRRIWHLAAPIIISNISVPLVGAVDTAVVGHLPDPVYIGAVALGAIIFSFLFWGFGFLRMGTSGFVAQAYGNNDLTEVRTVLSRALLLALLLSALVVLLQKPIGWLAFWTISGSARLESLAQDYYHIRIWSAPATLANYALLGTMIAMQNTRAALLSQLLLNGSNVLLDLLFVLVLEWGVSGVALASVIAEYLAAGFALWIVMRSLRSRQVLWPINNLWESRKIKALLRVNLDIFIRTLCLTSAFFYLTVQGTKMGEVILAANTILINLLSILAHGLDGFANAVEALAGAAYGARNREKFRAAVKYSSIWAFIVALVFVTIYALCSPLLIGWLTSIKDVQQAALIYFPWIVLTPLLAVWGFQLDGIFIATTHTREMRYSMIMALLVFLLASWIFIPLWHNHGLWLAFVFFTTARAVTLGLYYPRIEQAIISAAKSGS